MQLRWIASPRASAFHAAEAVARGLPLTEPSLAEKLAAPVATIERVLDASAVDRRMFWRRLVPLSVKIADHRRLAEMALRSGVVKRLSKELAGVEDVVHSHWPRLEELRLRERPLREQWEARGLGFLRRASALIHSATLVAEADVALVHPCLGGGGEAHREFSLVGIEAMLANPRPELPEALRLGWLLLQLTANDQKSSERRWSAAGLAILAVALEAGESVEWTRFDQQTLEAALIAFRLPLPEGGSPAAVAGVLYSWRRRIAESPIPWSDALNELDASLRPIR